MASPLLAVKSIKNKTIFMELFLGLTSYSEVFDVADSEYEVRI